jgi:hypothetical protein
MKFLNRARSAVGPLRQVRKDQLACYFSNPSPTVADWDLVAQVVIAKGVNVHDAVCAVDPSFQTKLNTVEENPQLRWDRAPDGFTVARAVKAALA